MPNRNLKILIVEDDLPTATLLQTVLSKDGHSVKAAGDGPSALAAALEDPPDAAIIDITLPGGIDGFEVANKVRLSKDGRRTFVTVLTADVSPETKSRSEQEGIDFFLTKPVDIDVLLKLLSRFHAALFPGMDTVGP